MKLGVPTQRGSNKPMEVDLNEVAKVFPYGRLLPMEVVVGGLSFSTGRIVREWEMKTIWRYVWQLASQLDTTTMESGKMVAKVFDTGKNVGK